MQTIREMYSSGFDVDFPGMPSNEFELMIRIFCGPDWKFFNGDKLTRNIDFKGPDIYSWDDGKRCYFPDSAESIATFSRIKISDMPEEIPES
jgi:hypothetical protein